MEDGSRDSRLVAGQATLGITVKVQAGGDGGPHWAAAAGVERQRQLCRVFSRLPGEAWLGLIHGRRWRSLAEDGVLEGALLALHCAETIPSVCDSVVRIYSNFSASCADPEALEGRNSVLPLSVPTVPVTVPGRLNTFVELLSHL